MTAEIMAVSNRVRTALDAGAEPDPRDLAILMEYLSEDT